MPTEEIANLAAEFSTHTAYVYTIPMPSKRLLIGLVVLIGLAIPGLLLFTGNHADGMCHGTTPKSFQVNIQNGVASNTNVQAHVCDKLTFKNLDNVTREVAFGPHENHIPYDGVAERFLNKGQSFTIDLNALGRYHWHDHLHDDTEGFFTVSK